MQNLHSEQFDSPNSIQHEQAHQHIVRGEYKKALYLIEELEANGEEGVFLTFYKAKALKDTELMSRVREQFKKEHLAYICQSLIGRFRL